MSVGGRDHPIVLYSDDAGIGSHRVRLTLAEKGLEATIESVEPRAPPPALARASPRGELPALIDRDLSLHGTRVIEEYLDERYPHPPLMPPEPLPRARVRLALHRIESEWYAALPLGEAPPAGAPSARRGGADELRAMLVEADEVFAATPFFLGHELSVLDVALAPLLWRLPHCGIVLPEASAAARYARRMFARATFRASLSPREAEMGR